MENFVRNHVVWIIGGFVIISIGSILYWAYKEDKKKKYLKIDGVHVIGTVDRYAEGWDGDGSSEPRLYYHFVTADGVEIENYVNNFDWNQMQKYYPVGSEIDIIYSSSNPTVNRIAFV